MTSPPGPEMAITRLRLDLRPLFRKWGRKEGAGWALAIVGANAVGSPKAGPKKERKRKRKKKSTIKTSNPGGKKKRKSRYKTKGARLEGKGGSLSVEAAKSKFVKRKSWGYVYKASSIGGKPGSAKGRAPGQKLTWYRRGTVYARAHPFKDPKIQINRIAAEIAAEVAQAFRQFDKKAKAG